MRKMLLMVILSVILVGTGGCFVSVKEECSSNKHIQSPNPRIDSTIAEIDAVGKLATESARLNVLRAIAARPGLSQEARIHLVEAVGKLATESAREEILMTLAKNPPEPMPQPAPVPEPCDD